MWVSMFLLGGRASGGIATEDTSKERRRIEIPRRERKTAGILLLMVGYCFELIIAISSRSHTIF